MTKTARIFRLPPTIIGDQRIERLGRVARMTLDIPGKMPIRQWVLVPCNDKGEIFMGTAPTVPLDAMTGVKFRDEVEIAIQRSGAFATVSIVVV